MSKNSWLPTRKGTDLFPAETQVPAVLRIKDVRPGTELYTAIAKEYGGRLKQFHAKAQQSHALSVNPISRVRQQFGDEAQATYTNIHGNETVELEVSRSKLGKMQVKPRSPWDWAIINFKVINPPSDATFAAFMIAPLLQHITPDLVTAKGVTFYPGGDNGLGDKPISFPNPDRFTSLAPLIVDSGYTAGSLAVDMKVVGPESQVVIDVYGKIEGARMCLAGPRRLPLTYEIVFPLTCPPTGFSPPPTLDTVGWILRGNVQFRLPDCSDVTINFYLGSLSSNFGSGTHSATLSQTWTIDIDESTSTVVTMTAVRSGALLTVTVGADSDLLTVDGDWDPSSNNVGPDEAAAGETAAGWWDFTVSGTEGGAWVADSFSSSMEITYSNPTQSGSSPGTQFESWTPVDGRISYNIRFIGYLERTAPPAPSDAEVIECDVIVAGIVGKGDPDWIYSTHTSDFDFNAWEMRALYPQPIPTAIINRTLKISTTALPDAPMFDHYGLPKLGTLIADRKYGALTWKSA